MSRWPALAAFGGALAVAAGLVFVSLRRAWRRAAASLAESEALSRQLAVQADELRRRVEESEALRAELELSNIELVEASAEAHHARASAEAAARRKEEVLAILDTVLDSSPVAFALYDRGLRFIRINRAFAEVTGLAALDHIGATLDEVAPMIAPALVPSLQRVLKEDRPLRDVELSAPVSGPRLDSQAATRRYWLASFYPVRTARGGVLGVGALMLEDSERKNLEEQFRQAQKMEAVGRLAGGIAHDFNNLLTVMSSCSELLLRDLAQEDRRRNDVEEIRRAAQRAAGLTRQLLAFSRKQILQPTMVDLNAVVSEMERMLRRVLGEDIQLETVLDPELGFVRADPGQIEQVLMNLVVNARDAMPRGGRIVLRTRNVPRPSGEVLVALEVKDDGIGIASEALPYIFEPFYTTKEQGKGTGLGLSTVYGIVKQSGGDVEVETMPGAGATFRIVLPRYREALVARPVSPARGVSGRTSGTILLVEDEESVRSLAMRVLTREGYVVHSASRGDEAERIFTAHESQIALLVADMILPGLAGIELARRLRERRPALKVLLMSGYTDRDVGSVDRDVDAVGLLQKPFTPDMLLKRVAEQFAGTTNAQSARTG
ncbi:MAG: response regulator [Gemmatimonadaceae bacterium]|nr:response regulator [Gemmatimonadaceae bacterium]